MKIRHYAFAALSSLAVWPVEAKEITLPLEKAQLVESPLPGYVLASSFCYTCHSADYVHYQPPVSTRAWWKATVVKMQKTFGAPIPEGAVDPIVDYLVKTYGAERATPGAAPLVPAQTEVPKP
jgi:hypothetical protein